jgi:hypothetical protein
VAIFQDKFVQPFAVPGFWGYGVYRLPGLAQFHPVSLLTVGCFTAEAGSQFRYVIGARSNFTLMHILVMGG